MNIGLLTLPFNNNYGGYLQAYALMTVLKKLGHVVCLIYRRNNRRSKKWIIKNTIKNAVKIILRKKIICIVPDQEKELRCKGKNMMRFVDRYIIPRSKPLYSTSSMYKYLEESCFDAIVVGSDQVWRPDYGQKHVQDFFLTELRSLCHKKPLCVFYAASFGADSPSYTEKEKKECGEAIKQFEAISVRENKALELITNFNWKSHNNPIVVLDPTFLLKKNHYNSLLPTSQSISKGKIFCYFLDNSQESQEIQREAEKLTGMEIFSIIDTKNWQRPYYIMPSIEDWLSGIRDAEFVLTDSYHGMVFSIIFNKPFLVLCNAMRGSNRFTSVLSLLDLENRLIFDANNIWEKMNSEIVWKDINAKLDLEIKNSMDFIRKVLS